MRIILTTQGILSVKGGLLSSVLKGGLSRSVPLLARALAEQGVDVHLVVPGYGASRSTLLLPSPPVQSHILPQRVLRFFPKGWRTRLLTWLWRSSFSRTIKPLLAGNSSSLIHDNGIWLPSNHWSVACAKKMRVPLMISSRGMLSEWAMQNRGGRKQLAWRCYQRSDLEAASVIHATSLKEAREIRNAQLRQPIAMIPNGVELPPMVERAERRKQKSESRTLLFLGRLHPVKGLSNLVEAWATIQRTEVRDQRPEINSPVKWRVIIAGGDEKGHLSDIKEALRKQEVENDFEFVGPVEGEAKWNLYRSADLFVLPSHSENFGLVVAEALACSLPVIATHGTPWEDLITYRCGWWVEIGSRPLATALSQAMGLSDAERQAMGLRGRKLVEEHYTWPAAARKMVGVYQWMLGRGERPECVIES